MKRDTSYLLPALILCLAFGTTAAQSPDTDESRDITPVSTAKRTFREARKGKSRPAGPQVAVRPNVPASRRKQVASAFWRDVVGFSIVRLRPRQATDALNTAEIMVGSARYTGEVVKADTTFSLNDQLRLVLESATRDGYFYVIAREIYANGPDGPPKLIFPTQRTRNGDNRVSAATLLELPSLDNPSSCNCFTIKSSRFDYAGERLTIILSPQPLKALSPDLRQKELLLPFVTGLERDWQKMMQRVDLNPERPWTKAEQLAASETRELVPDAPAPMAAYSLKVPLNRPAVFQVEFKVAASASARK